jgi:hypothetical protein
MPGGYLAARFSVLWPNAGCTTLVRRCCGQGGSRESSTALAASRSGRSTQQPFGADVFVNLWPVDTVAASRNLPMAPVADWPLESPARLAMSVNVNRNHHLRSSAQAAEEVAGDLHPAIFAAQQVLPVCRFRACADAGACIHPGSAKIPANVARRDPHPGIVANPLDLAGVRR